MATAAEKTRYTPEQYLTLERKAAYKSEYREGNVYAMTRANRTHNLITGNVCAEIGRELLDRPCEVYVSDMRVRITATGLYTYPDVVVACGGPQFEDREVDTLLNPTLIVEVLSDSTEAYDRGVKFKHYRRLPSLQQYVLVSQDRVLVERFTRQGDEWLLAECSDLQDVLRLPSIACEVSLRQIYAKVEFPAQTNCADPAAPEDTLPHSI